VRREKKEPRPREGREFRGQGEGGGLYYDSGRRGSPSMTGRRNIHPFRERGRKKSGSKATSQRKGGNTLSSWCRRGRKESQPGLWGGKVRGASLQDVAAGETNLSGRKEKTPIVSSRKKKRGIYWF